MMGGPTASSSPPLTGQEGAGGKENDKQNRRNPQGQKNPVFQLTSSGDAALGPHQELIGGQPHDFNPSPPKEVNENRKQKQAGAPKKIAMKKLESH